MGITPFVKLLGKRCPVTLNKMALGAKMSHNTNDKISIISEKNTFNPKRSLYDISPFLKDKRANLLSFNTPHSTPINNIHTKIRLFMLSEKCPQNHFIPSLPNKERIEESGFMAFNTHERRITDS